MIRVPRKVSALALGLLGIFLGFSAWATDFCPTLLDRLREYDKVAQFQKMVDRRSFKRFYGDAETRPIVDSIAQLKPIQLHRPFELTGSVTEQDGVLTIHLDGIGPVVGTQPARQTSISQMKGAMIGVPDFFQAEETANPRMIKAVSAVLEGVEQRLAANPKITKIVFQTKDIMNQSLKWMLVDKMNFHITSSSSMGGAHMQLELDLAEPSAREIKSLNYCF